MAKQKETLEEGLNREANKKALTGKERKRYIGGTITNLEKRGVIKKVNRKPPPHKPRAILVLSVKKNSAESKKRGYDVYSLYRSDGTQFNAGTWRSRAKAAAAKIDEEAAHALRLKQKRFKP